MSDLVPQCRSQSSRTPKAKRIFVCLAFILTVLECHSVYAQAGIPHDGITSQHDYATSTIDSVNLDTGNLILDIPIISYKQRGSLPDFSLIARYNTSNWLQVDDYENVSSPSWIIVDPGESGRVNIQNLSGWNFFGTGVQIVRGDALSKGTVSTAITYYNGEPGTYTQTYVEDGTGTQHLMYLQSGATGARAMDGSGIGATNVDIRSSLTNVIDGHGIVHTAVPDGGDDGFFDSISDPSGNSITPVTTTVYRENVPLQQVDHWVDSVGRVIPAPPDGINGLSPGCYPYQYPSSGSGTALYTFCYSNVQVSSAYGEANISDTGPYPVVFLTSVLLPNGTSYTFSYDTWGELSGIGLPGGGHISYGWVTAGDTNSGTSIRRVLRTRTIDASDGLPVRTWTYCFSNRVAGCLSNVNSMIDPDGNETWRLTSSLSPPVVATIQYQGPANNGIALKSSASTYCNFGGVYRYVGIQEPKLVCEKDTTLSDGEVVAEKTTFDTPTTVSDPIGNLDSNGFNLSLTATMSIGVPTTQTISNYGSASAGSTLKTTATQYLWQSNTNYYQANFLDLPSSVTISDGNGTTFAQTIYAYDENNGSPQGIYGNTTSVSKWVGSSSSSVKTTAVYNGQGMITDTYDGNWNAGVAGNPGNHINTVYDSTGLYPSVVAQSTTGGVNHVNYYSYDKDTGNLKSSTDQNGSAAGDVNHTTTWSYDNMGRITAVSYPDGGGSSYCYTDVGGAICQAGPAPYSSFATTRLSGTANISNSVSYDGLGEVVRKFDPSGAATSISYNAQGRVQVQSNPYLVSPSLYLGFTYDALGRPLYKCNQDNGTQPGSCAPGQSYQSWFYSGPTTVSRDESGNSYTRTTDSLGRLVIVLEPSGSKTYYQYDVLGNLVCMAQDGGTGAPFNTCAASSSVWHPRTFIYDGLSRLAFSYNPESGGISYGYDSNGNVTSKTDARGLLTGYQYDALGRILRMTVPVVNPSGAVAGEYESNCYQYDSISGAPGSANLIGHLAAEWTQAGNTCASSYNSSVVLTAKVILGYDALGRPLMSQQCIKGMCQTSPFTQNQTYDLAGNMTSWTDGRGLMTFSQQFDSAGRPASLTNSVSGSGFPSVLFSAQAYTPANALQNWNVGGYLNFFRSYDNRLRVTSESVAH